MIHNALSKYYFLFNLTLRICKTKPVDSDMWMCVDTIEDRLNKIYYGSVYDGI